MPLSRFPIGRRNVEGTLGTIWAKAGDQVMFSSRHLDELKDLAAKAGPNAKTGTPADAAAFGDVVLMAVPYAAFADIAKANEATLKGKVVLDASNAIDKRDGAALGGGSSRERHWALFADAAAGRAPSARL